MDSMYIDFATICIYLFWFFFAALIIYLRREDKREGYPLESDRQGVTVQGFPAMPGPRRPLAPHPAVVDGMPPEPLGAHHRRHPGSRGGRRRHRHGHRGAPDPDHHRGGHRPGAAAAFA